MNNFNPLVSIVIPVYNGANYMAEAIDSALAQTYSNIEILVINDGSNDGGKTRNIALGYGNQIRYIEKENGGVATALNLGIKKMQGEYFSWLSHDDKYFSDKIETQIDFLSHLNDKNVILYSDIEYIDKDSKLLSRLKLPHYTSEYFRPAFIKDGLINGCTLLVPRVCFEKCGVFNPTLRTTQDYDLWFRISDKYDFIHQPKILIQSRLHDNQDTIRLYDTSNEERDKLHQYFIENISLEEISLFSKGNVTGYYLSFSKMMAAYLCTRAEKTALSLAIKSLLKDNLLRIAQNFIKLITLLLIIGAKKLFVLFFGLNALLKLKKIVRIYILRPLNK